VLDVVTRLETPAEKLTGSDDISLLQVAADIVREPFRLVQPWGKPAG